MEHSLQASRNGVAFRRPTFDGTRIVKNFFRGVMWRLELLGRAKAAAELSRFGYHDQARALMLELVKERD